jgi:hypothetical protein
MGQFLHKYNTDNVHARAVIIGLVNLLNTKIQYDNVLSDTQIDTVTVPFFYSMTGDERFLQDYFLEWNECIHPKIADGNYDVIPRGVVQLTSNTINTAAMTHRFVRGSYVKEVNGQLQTFNAFINSIPLTMDFTVNIETDNNLDAFKIQQTIIETFYKTQVYSVSYKGFRVPCQVGFPEDYGVEKTFEFSYGDNEVVKMSFTLTVETYQPVTDPTTQRSNANRITSQGGPGLSYTSANVLSFTAVGPSSNGTYFSGTVVPIRWSSTGVILRTNVYYRIQGSTNWVMIGRSIENTGEFDWIVPFFNSQGEEIGKDPIRATAINQNSGTGAVLRCIINANGEVEKLIIINGGYAYDNTTTIEVSPLIPPASGFTPATITATVASGTIIGYEIINPGSGYPPSPDNQIEIKIESATDETLYKVFDYSPTFTGNTNPSLPLPGLKQITNISPTVNELVAQGVDLTNVSINGQGVESGSKIISADAINNLINVDRNVTIYSVNGDYILEPQTAIFNIQ